MGTALRGVLTRVNSVNGLAPDESTSRPDFERLTAVFPQEWLRLQTEPDALIARTIDAVTPLAKGQRATIIAPPKSGRSTILMAIADALSINFPECHLMVTMLDERPEKVTQMQRSVRGEVISSGHPDPPQERILMVELAAERARRLVELGHDVVMVLDSLTAFCRAHIQASTTPRPSDIDPVWRHPAERLFGAGRNIEDGGSLTMIAVLRTDTGSVIDDSVTKAFQHRGDVEIQLDSSLAAWRFYPAINLPASTVFHETAFMNENQVQTFRRLCDELRELDQKQAYARLSKTLQVPLNDSAPD
jgi:transcription termination factor Rho